MGDKATLRMARQELEDLYLGVPDDSVDLTFKDLAFPAAAASSSLPATTTTTTTSNLPTNNAAAAVDVAADDERKKMKQATGALARSPTNIFTYRPLEDHHEDADSGLGGGLQLPPSPAAAAADDHYRYDPAAVSAAAAAGGGRERRAAHNNNYYKRPGIPHSNICALCNNHVYLFRHRCLVCGRVYCRRCVGGGMGDMTEGRKCVDCLGRRYSHRYIHRAGDTAGCGFCYCFWGYHPSAKAVTAQELIWAEKGPAPRRRPRPRPAGSSSISASYGYYSSTNTVASASASMSMAMNSDSSIATAMKMNGLGKNASTSGMPASASSSFVASFPRNPHAFPL